MESPQQLVKTFARAVALSITLACVGCGSTSPSGPSPVSNPSVQYPALAVGHWPGTADLVLHYRDAAGGSDSWACQAALELASQTGGTFAGDVSLNGTGSNEPPCLSVGFTFTASMAPD